MGRPKLDIVGCHFGKLTVVGFSHSDSSSSYWLCKCDCGTEVIKRGSYLKNTNVKHSCGCKDIPSDQLGKKYGNLTVLEYAKTENKVNFWRCKCNCGTEKLVRTNDLKKVKTCGCSRIHKDPRTVSIKFVIYRYKRRAKSLGVHFNLDESTFLNLVEANCHYCGSPPANDYSSYNTSKASVSVDRKLASHFIYNGIDRVDNTKGYELDNVVTCCKFCNLAKHTRSYEDFIKWCDNLAEYWSD